MPTNNFKLFDENKANLLTDTEYGNSTQRLNGVQTGVASSQLNNKFAYQVSLVAYAIAQLMNANGLDASDTLAVSAFVGNLQGAILQKVADKATSAEAAAGVLSNKYITPETMKAAALLLSGGVMNGVLDMGGNKITNLGTPTLDSDAATKGYVDNDIDDLKPIVIFEENFENEDGSSVSYLPAGYNLSNYINNNKRKIVAEGFVTNITKAVNTSNSSYDSLEIEVGTSTSVIASFNKGETLNNIQYKNKVIYESPLNISQDTTQGKVPSSFSFGFLTVNNDFTVKSGIRLYLTMTHGEVYGSSGCFRVYLI